MNKNKNGSIKMIGCCFAGHRVAPCSLLEEIILAIENLVRESEAVEFYSGGMGDFDKLCEQAVRDAKKKFPQKDIRLSLVLPSYRYAPQIEHMTYMKGMYDDIFVCDASDGVHYKAMIGKRNRWMVEKSDVIIAYVRHETGGAYTTLKYAVSQNLRIIQVGLDVKNDP